MHFRIGCRGKQLSYIGKHAGICGRIGTRSPAYGRLADLDHFIEILHSLHRLKFSGPVPGSVQLIREVLIQYLIDKRRFSGAGNTCNTCKRPKRNRDVYTLEIVFSAPIILRKWPFPFLRCSGISIFFLPLRYCPVIDSSHLIISSALP